MYSRLPINEFEFELILKQCFVVLPLRLFCVIIYKNKNHTIIFIFIYLFNFNYLLFKVSCIHQYFTGLTRADLPTPTMHINPSSNVTFLRPQNADLPNSRSPTMYTSASINMLHF